MARELSRAQLLEWYRRFTKEVYEKANIDINRVEDLGRIKHFHITEWEDTKPNNPVCTYTYAFMNCDGDEYENPPPRISDHKAYGRWMLQNLKTNLSEKQMRTLYEMSQKGQLMITPPGGSTRNMRQVFTDENGTIITSLPAHVYNGSESLEIPEEQKMPERLLFPEESIDPVDYDLPPMPQIPQEPENLHPGFGSYIGYLLGVNTNYTKLAQYKKQLDEVENWHEILKTMDPKKKEAYNKALEKHQQYKEKLEAFRAHRLGRLSAIENGFRENIPSHEFEELLLFETQFLLEQHTNKTPLGKLTKGLLKAKESSAYAEQMQRIIRNLVGHNPNPDELQEWIQKGVFEKGRYQPVVHALPKNPFDQSQKKEQKAFEEKWASLAEIACFAALADEDVSGVPPRIGCTKSETADLNFAAILKYLFTEGHPNSSKYVDLLNPARAKGMEAVYAFYQNEPQALAQLLANGIRRINREVAKLSDLNSRHSICTLYLADRLMRILREYPELLALSGLNPEELEETEANLALYRIVCRGQEAKREVLEHALFQKDLSPKELQSAGEDVLFAYIVSDQVEREHNQQQQELSENPEYRNIQQKLKKTAGYRDLLKELDEARADQAKNLLEKEQVFKKMLEENRTAVNKLALLEQRRPGFSIGKMVRSRSWAEEAKNAMIEKCNLGDLSMMNRESIGKIFASDLQIQKTFYEKEAEEMEAIQEELERLFGIGGPQL